LISEYGFTAKDAIGWIRVCRPGSVIGPQQLYLVDYEKQIKKMRAAVEEKVSARELASATMIPIWDSRPTSSRRLRFTPAKGVPAKVEDDENQALRSNSARRSRKQAEISRPFKRKSMEKYYHIRSVAIEAVHPQPRKVNQRSLGSSPRGDGQGWINGRHPPSLCGN
jgi:cell division cycle 14